MVALAALMPIVAGVGGNAGTQTLPVTVRALAMNQLTDSNSWRAICREMKIDLLHGGTIALDAGTDTSLWFGNPQLCAVLAEAMVVNIFVEGGCRGALPLCRD